MPNKEPKQKNKKKTIWMIVGIVVGVIILALVVMFVVRYFAKTKEELAQANSASLNYGGVAGSVDSKDADFWNNPTQVATYVSDACGRGRNYMPTSKSECERIPLGAETISETEWLKRLSSRATNGTLTFPAEAISTRATTAARAALKECATLGYTESKYDGKPEDPAITAAADAAASVWCTYYTSACKVSNFKSDFDQIVKLDKNKWNAGNSSRFCHMIKDVLDDSKAKTVEAAREVIYKHFSGQFTAANCAIDNKNRVDPTLENLYVVYPMTDACQKIKDAETAKCVESVQTLVNSGSIKTLTALNDAALKTE